MFITFEILSDEDILESTVERLGSETVIHLKDRILFETVEKFP